MFMMDLAESVCCFVTACEPQETERVLELFCCAVRMNVVMADGKETDEDILSHAPKG